MPNNFLKTKFLAWFFLSILGYAAVGYATPRAEFGLLVGLWAGLFAGYAFALKQARQESGGFSEKAYFRAAILFRLVLLGATPLLSDDYFRFFYDGHLLASGQNPYLVLPSQHPDWPLFELLNSKNYYTVYPPLHQAFTALGPGLFPRSFFGQIVTLRVLIVGAEIGTLFLLQKLLTRYGLPRRAALVYTLNPLVIIELTGNLHLEGVMLFFLLLSIWLLPRNWLFSALCWGAAIAVKLLPLLFLPLLVKRLGWARALGYFGVVAGLNAALFAPFFSLELVKNMASSLDLYFQKFEFNASLYYLVRAVGFWATGYNIIQAAGPWLAVAALGIMAAVFVWDYQSKSPAPARLWVAILLIHSSYLFFSTTVHPWYLCSLLGYSVLGRWRFGVGWSGVAVLAYAAYSNPAFRENPYLVALEYALVYGWFGTEVAAVLRTKSPSKSTAFW